MMLSVLCVVVVLLLHAFTINNNKIISYIIFYLHLLATSGPHKPHLTPQYRYYREDANYITFYILFALFCENFGDANQEASDEEQEGTQAFEE